MTLTQLLEAEQSRAAEVKAARERSDEARAEYHRAQQRLAYATKKNHPESAMVAARLALHDARNAYQRARRALLRAI